MAGIKQIRKRIIGIKKTEQITKAMKMVATVKFKKAYNAMHAAEPYFKSINNIFAELQKSLGPDYSHFLFEPKKSDKKLIIVISSDRGLCGNFNSKLFDHVLQTLGNEKSAVFDVMPIGKKAKDFFKKQKFGIIRPKYDSVPKISHNEVKEINSDLVLMFKESKYGEIYVSYNEFKNAMISNIALEKIFPIERSAVDKISDEYCIFEPSLKSLMEGLLPEFIGVKISRAVLHSFASEQGIRMTMMDQATENAEDLIANLTLLYNKERQASITKEIAEISTASEALK